MSRRPIAALLGLLAIGACRLDTEIGSNARDRAPADAGELDASGPACADLVDNDDDGAIDFPYEPGCGSPDDDDERDPATAPACANQDDDDGDGVTDFPGEPGCESAADADEVDPATPPACADGVDNDDSGAADYPGDPGCYGAGDPVEYSVVN